MQKAILMAIYLIVAGCFVSEYTSAPFGPILAWLGIIIGILPTITWMAEGIKKWGSEHPNEREDASDESEDSSDE